MPATIVEVAGLLGTGTVRNLAADAILDSFPLALRTSSPGGWLSDAARSSARRAQMLKSTDDTATLRSTLQRLAVEVATLTREPDQQVQNSPIGDLRASAPDAALLVVGAPISSGQVPVVAALPGGDLVLHLPLLDSAAVDMIDALGRLADGDSADVLWRPAARSWQHVLGDLFLPSALGDHLAQGPPGDLLLVVHPTLAHLPFEALKIPGQGPLGVAAAVRRLPLLAQSEHQIHLTADVAFFDPAHRWPAEQAVVGAGEPSVGAWLAAIGAGTLGVFAAHGNPGAGFDGWLTTADQSGIVTAADLLLENLAGSAFVFEACWAGRHVGHRSGETLNMTTAALLSGASSVIAGLWALPADPDCTGQITADCLAAIKRGTRPAEALRRAREQFLAIPTETFAVPGSAERMERSAPWAWAGLCAFG
ncbi:MAG: CHAT domain-containing protein [Frankiaceae bacterium]|nr:CHAT domain-containing protein [Frankiaceae bacterium]